MHQQFTDFISSSMIISLRCSFRWVSRSPLLRTILHQMSIKSCNFIACLCETHRTGLNVLYLPFKITKVNLKSLCIETLLRVSAVSPNPYNKHNGIVDYPIFSVLKLSTMLSNLATRLWFVDSKKVKMRRDRV